MFNALTIAYFFAGNGIYTFLMGLSLLSAISYNRRLAYRGFSELRDPGAAPPLTIIIPAYNEEGAVLETVHSALLADYPGLRVLVVDDGSSDGTLARLIDEFKLSRSDFIYRPFLSTAPAAGLYTSPGTPQLQVLSKRHGGKSDALNAGINFCRTPYFCTLDADSLIEPDALLRLMRPAVLSPAKIVVSGGIIRILNGCRVSGGRISQIHLPRSWIENLQVVEYLRSFLYGRAGWDLIAGTLIVSGAMAVFHRETVLQVGGFRSETVAEDMELIVRLHRWSRQKSQNVRMAFTMETVCWTQCPKTVAMLARQRRRWHLGLCQTLWLNSEMLFNPKYGCVGMFSFPFHLYVEGLGAAVELAGYAIIPLAFALHLALSAFYIPLVVLSLVYASFLSVGAVLLEEITYRRYPAKRDLAALLGWAIVENFGFRQLILCFRFQGFLRFLSGFQNWETVVHTASETEA